MDRRCALGGGGLFSRPLLLISLIARPQPFWILRPGGRRPYSGMPRWAQAPSGASPQCPRHPLTGVGSLSESSSAYRTPVRQQYLGTDKSMGKAGRALHQEARSSEQAETVKIIYGEWQRLEHAAGWHPCQARGCQSRGDLPHPIAHLSRVWPTAGTHGVGQL